MQLHLYHSSTCKYYNYLDYFIKVRFPPITVHCNSHVDSVSLVVVSTICHY